MSKRTRRIEEPTITVEDKPVTVATVPVEVEAVKPVLLDSDIVTVKVLFGSVSFRAGTFEAGETFTTTRKQASEFDQRFIQIV